MRKRNLVLFLIVLCMAMVVVMVALAADAFAFGGKGYAREENTQAEVKTPVRTAKQEALHQAADILRDVGYTDDSVEIKTLQAAWMAEQENLNIVARVVMGEAGYCPWEHKVAVAAVVVNRTKSPYFPSTVREVVAQPYQYTTLYLTGFEKTTRECYEAAKVALDGTDDVPDDVIWQAEFVQGTSVWWASVVDTGWYRSTTYFCRGVAW